ncbi:hypothetical protein BJ878DRAFT_510476 [Calycina marina]|uniref:Peptidase M20 dimerisation domain-containing protein n=1 Tax=Calycina marina TaxID=1763456 RepID=A0A9P8CDW2_9HELO|nr:hypothetical protein BJ878DRAFT_510476 [Calycina marina]
MAPQHRIDVVHNTSYSHKPALEIWNGCASRNLFGGSSSTMCQQDSPWRSSTDEGGDGQTLWSEDEGGQDLDSASSDKEPAESGDNEIIDRDDDILSPDGLDPDHLKERPELTHYLENDSSVLSLAAGEQLIYAGTQDGDIVVWSFVTFERVMKIKAHTGAVLCLFLSANGKLLFSGAGDAIVNTWCAQSLKRLYSIYSTYDVGEVFSVAYSAQFETVYLGAQNTSIQWASLKDSAARPTPNPERHPNRRNHRFFDSVQAGGTSTPRPQPTTLEEGEQVEIDKAHMMHYAHYGYVYCMLLVHGVSRLVDADHDMLISGGGDGTIKLWKLSSNESEGIKEVAVLGEDNAESILSMAVDGSFLYSSKPEGIIELWDLDTKQKLRVIKAHRGNVMTLQMGWGYLWSAGSTGFARKYTTAQYGKYQNSTTFNQKYHCIKRWKAHDGRVLASAVTTFEKQQYYITGATDNSVSVWNITGCETGMYTKLEVHENQLIKSLQEFVSFKTISSRPDHAEDCRRGATFLRTLFKKHGAQTEMLNTDNHGNPVVYAKFKGNPATAGSRKKILFYGHYDVVPADNKLGQWRINPFEMKGINGYLYGRGVSDNKGPIMAALYGVVDLVQNKSLDSDITFLIEGEEESGSRGFKEAVRHHKELIGDIDYIILANSYWLDDEVPCLTYGLRGVLHATIKVDSNHPDMHSGVDGSFMMDEPLFDLTSVLAKLKGLHNRVQIPNFYDNILPLTATEEARYDDITETLIRRNPALGPADVLKASLKARWREPNLTIHRYRVSGPDGSLVSAHASAAISLRLVPNQEVDDVSNSLSAFLHSEFAKLDTHNRLDITIDNTADAWLGDLDNAIFRTLEEAIMEVWGPIGEGHRASTPNLKAKLPLQQVSPSQSPSLKPSPTTTATLTGGSYHTSLASVSLPPSTSRPPSIPRRNSSIKSLTSAVTPLSPPPVRSVGRKPLYIREGGSIPSIRFLEKEFGAPAAHLPCGQASDSAHLDNERLRVKNLLKSREIFAKVFGRLGNR